MSDSDESCGLHKVRQGTKKYEGKHVFNIFEENMRERVLIRCRRVSNLRLRAGPVFFN